MDRDNSENPFQSPVVPETDRRPPFPAGVFCGVAVALVAFCGALTWVQPGAGILASLLVVPGLLRGFIQLHRRVGGTEERMGTLPQILFSIFLMIPVLVATVISFGATCFASMVVATELDSIVNFLNPGRVINGVFAVSVLVATLTFAVMFWVFLFTGKKHPPKPDGEPEVEEIQ